MAHCYTNGWYNTINEGIPAIPRCLMLAKGRWYYPYIFDKGPRSPWRMPHRGYIQSWNGTFERQLPGSMIGSIGYDR